MDGIDNITAARLSHHVNRLAAGIGERNVFHPQALQAAEDYVRQYWEQQDYVAMGVRSANLEITRHGSQYPEEIILLGAHYDSVRGSPGANNTGSGVAALLELSRLFSTIEAACSVRFVAFTNEEPPFFHAGRPGSMLYARQACSRGDAIRLMIALETIGSYCSAPGSHYLLLFRNFFPDRGDFIAFVSNFRSRKPMRRLAQAFREGLGFPPAACLDICPGSRRGLERAPVNLAQTLLRHADHRHGLVSLSLLPHRAGHARQAELRGVRPHAERAVPGLADPG